MNTVFSEYYWSIVVFGETREQAWDRYYSFYYEALQNSSISAAIRASFEKELATCEQVLKNRFIYKETL